MRHVDALSKFIYDCVCWRLLLCALLCWPLLAWSAAAVVLEPGDILSITLPNESGFDKPFPIDKDGNVLLPEVGQTALAGLSLDQATTTIRQRLSVIYKELSLLNVTLKERRLLVNMLGFVNKPGNYDLPGGANIEVAIRDAGGFTPGAELDKLQVRRGDSVIEFNYKAYLDSGDPKLLPSLKTLDTVFVPTSKLMGNIALNADAKSLAELSNGTPAGQGQTVGLIGGVAKPGMYRWTNKLSLIELLAEAGGPVERADLAHIEIMPNHGGSPELFNLNEFIQKGGDLSTIPSLHEGYTVRVPILPDSEGKSMWVNQPADSTVYIFGQVGKPGRYAFGEGMGFLDVLSAADGPTGDADMQNLRIIHRDTSRPFVDKVNLTAYFQTGDESVLPRLLPGDSVYIPSSTTGNWLDKSSQATVRVLGAVGKPGRYLFNDSMTVLDVLAEAGGPTATAWVKRIIVVNMSCCQHQARSFNLEKFAKTGDPALLPVVRAGDTIYIPDISTSTWRIFMDTVKDVFYILATLQLLAGTNGSSGSGFVGI